jgi:hypothetical protein
MKFRVVFFSITCFLLMHFSQAQPLNIKWLVPEEVTLNQVFNTDNDVFDIKLEIRTNTRLKPEQIKIYRNNILYTAKGEKLGSTPIKIHADNHLEMNTQLELLEGKNEWIIEAVTPNQTIRSKLLRVSYTSAKPNLYLFCVGVMNDLRFPQKDAEAIYNTFRTQEGKLFGRVIPKLLVCKDKTTRSFIGSAIANLNEEPIRKQDLVILSFSGHGKTTTAFGNFDFGLLGSDFSQGVNVDEYLLLSYQKDIIKHLNTLPCKKIILIDACRSGAADGSKSEDFSEIQKRLGNTPASIITLSSSSSNESSWEDTQWQHGAFTRVLLDGLSGRADGDRNGFISIHELSDYIIITVPKLVDAAKNRKQTPRLIKPIEYDYQIFNYKNTNNEIKLLTGDCDAAPSPPLPSKSSQIAIVGLKPNTTKEYDILLSQLIKERLIQTDKEKFSFSSNTQAINIAKSGLAEKLIGGGEKSPVLPAEMTGIGTFLILKREPTDFREDTIAGVNMWVATTYISYFWIDTRTMSITDAGRLNMNGADADKITAEKRAIERLLETMKITPD